MKNFFRPGTIANLVFEYTLYLVVSGLFFGIIVGQIYGDGIRREQIPPGWEFVDQIVGGVWFVLLSWMIISRWQLGKTASPEAGHARILLLLYVVWCFAYTPIFGWTKELGLAGNILTLIVAGFIGVRLFLVSWFAFAPVALSFIWVSIASIYLVRLIQFNGLTR